MKILKSVKGINIEVYSSSKELPIGRYNEFQKYLVLESGIGSSIDILSNRHDRINAYIEEGRYIDAMRENNNAKLAVLAVINGVNYYTLAFACLVAKIGTESRPSLTVEDLTNTVEQLKELEITQHEIEKTVEDVKKKILQELEILFPDLNDKTSHILYYSRMKGYILNVCSIYSQDEISEKDRDELKHDYNWIIASDDCKNFSENDTENIIVQMDKNFITLCNVMESNSSYNPRNYTVEQFYGKLDYLNSQANKNERI